MLLELDALTIALSAGGQQQPDGEVQIDCILLYLTTKHVFWKFCGLGDCPFQGCSVYRGRSSVGHFRFYLQATNHHSLVEVAKRSFGSTIVLILKSLLPCGQIDCSENFPKMRTTVNQCFIEQRMCLFPNPSLIWHYSISYTFSNKISIKDVQRDNYLFK